MSFFYNVPEYVAGRLVSAKACRDVPYSILHEIAISIPDSFRIMLETENIWSDHVVTLGRDRQGKWWITKLITSKEKNNEHD